MSTTVTRTVYRVDERRGVDGLDGWHLMNKCESSSDEATNLSMAEHHYDRWQEQRRDVRIVKIERTDVETVIK